MGLRLEEVAFLKVRFTNCVFRDLLEHKRVNFSRVCRDIWWEVANSWNHGLESTPCQTV